MARDLGPVTNTGISGATTALRLVGGTVDGPPTTGTFAVGDYVISRNGRVYVCVIAGTPGTWTSSDDAQMVKRSVKHVTEFGDGTGGTYNSTAGTYGNGQWTGMPSTVGGSGVSAGERILVGHGAGNDNGIYVVTTVGSGANGVWDRASDFYHASQVPSSGLLVYNHNGNERWLLQNSPTVIGGASGSAMFFVPSPGYMQTSGTLSSATDTVSASGVVKTYVDTAIAGVSGGGAEDIELMMWLNGV